MAFTKSINPRATGGVATRGHSGLGNRKFTSNAKGGDKSNSSGHATRGHDGLGHRPGLVGGPTAHAISPGGMPCK